MGVRLGVGEAAGEVADGAKKVAEQAATSPLMEALLRLGFVVRGLVYGMIGFLALQVATGGRGEFTDTQGAIVAIGQSAYGNVLLYVILAGLVGYGLLGFIRAATDPLHKGNDVKGLAERIGYAVSGVSYLALGGATFNLIRGATAAARNGAQGDQIRQGATTILAKPWGAWVVGLGAVVVTAVGLLQIVRAVRRNFDRQFQPYALSAGQRLWIDRIGRFGAAARGLVFTLVGVFLLLAALRHDPNQAQGIDGVLATLLHQPYGPYLLGVVALGLIAFAIYSALSGLWLRLQR